MCTWLTTRVAVDLVPIPGILGRRLEYALDERVPGTHVLTHFRVGNPPTSINLGQWDETREPKGNSNFHILIHSFDSALFSDKFLNALSLDKSKPHGSLQCFRIHIVLPSHTAAWTCESQAHCSLSLLQYWCIITLSSSVRFNRKTKHNGKNWVFLSRYTKCICVKTWTNLNI